MNLSDIDQTGGSLQMYCRGRDQCKGYVYPMLGHSDKRKITLVCSHCRNVHTVKSIPAVIEALYRIKADYEHESVDTSYKG